MEQKIKHYLITGGAGFIGSHLIRKLLQDPYVYITCIDDFDTFYKREYKLQHIADLIEHPNFKLLELNIDHVTVNELHIAIPQPINYIVHLAAKAGVRPSISDPQAYIQTNIIGTQKLLDFAIQKHIGKFIFASSSSVYGINKQMPWKEDDVLLPISPYAMTKLAGEGAGHTYSYLYGLCFIALRLFTVYGPGQRPDLAIHRFTKAIINSNPISMYGDGASCRDYTYITDIVAGIMAALQYEASAFEIFNLGNNKMISLHALITALERIIGKKAIIDQQPEQLGDVSHTYADITKAKKLLGYHPRTNLTQGLQNFYEWFQQHANLLLTP